MNTCVSSYLDSFLSQIEKQAQQIPELLEIFLNCYTNTLNHAVTRLEDGTVYVVTGDIPAMWLRDSSAQMRPYLFPAKTDPRISMLIAEVIRKQFFYIEKDPYANSFNEKANGACWDKNDLCSNPWVWEEKFELDSLCYPIQLAYLLWKNTGYTNQFDEIFQSGIQIILDLFQREQYHEECSSYRFTRQNTYPTETLSRDGKGTLTNSGIGLVWSGFRPSDDACTYGYHIPSNMFAVVVLGYLEEIEEKIFQNLNLAKKANLIKKQIQQGIETYGKAKIKEFDWIYAYEVDGYGMYNLMDDANVPNLLSIPYLGYPADTQVAQNTRRFILSQGNPFYYEGKQASGIGSPHTKVGYIWHIAIAMEGLTSSDSSYKLKILQKMAATTAGKHLMHESFSCQDDSLYTREWFSWANAMYCELFLDYLGYRLKI